MLSVTPDTGETPADNRDFILPPLERFGLTTKGSEAEALEMCKFCELTASCWPSKTFSLSTLVRKMFHRVCAAICRALANTLCGRCWQRGGCGAKPCRVYSPLCPAAAAGPWQAGAGRGARGALVPSRLSVGSGCSSAESCWEDLLPWRSCKQPAELHCPGCEERFRIYEHWLEPNQTYLFCAVLFVKMTSFFMLINKGILTAPWTESATLRVLR